MKKYLILVSLLCIGGAYLNGQHRFEAAITSFQQETNAIVSTHSSIGNMRFARFPQGEALSLNGSTAIEKITHFMQQYKGVFLSDNDVSQWVITQQQMDMENRLHITLQQAVDDIPVYGAFLKFHFNTQMELTAINGWTLPNIPPSAIYAIPQNQAEEMAIYYTEQQHKNDSNAPLYIEQTTANWYQEGILKSQPSGKIRPAYLIEVSNGQHIREYVFIDAQTGKVLTAYSGMCHAINRSMYINDFNNLIWQEGDDFPGGLGSWQVRELTSTEHTYNLFKNSFGKNSFDGNDGEMIILHAPTGMDCPNASWNGIHTSFCIGVGNDDITAHEWAHAYTEYSSGLIYAWQSGAMNEAYSDIWGETVDLINEYDDGGEDLSLRNNCNDSDRWLIGEGSMSFGGAIRDMWLPSCFGDPEATLDPSYFCASGDNGGVHSNSGVINRAYALLVDGGSQNGINIDAIGLTKAAHLFWRVQSNYLTPVSDFPTFADAIEVACMDLMGMNLESLSTGLPLGPSGEIISIADCQAIANMITALELREAPDCDFQPILMQNPPALCAESDTVFYEDFENGLGSWTIDSLPSFPATWDYREWSIVGELPSDRPGSAAYVPNPIIGDCQLDLENGILRLESPIINIPEGDDIFPHLVFQHYIATEPFWDGGNIKYNLDGGGWELLPTAAFGFNAYNSPLNESDNPMSEEPSFTGLDEGVLFSTWGESQIDLGLIGATAGSSIQFRFELGEDGCNGRDGWYVDDILLYVCNDGGSVNTQPIISSQSLSISPNPMHDWIRIDLGTKHSGESQLEIVDISGRTIFSKSNVLQNDAQILLEDMNYLPKGIYVIRVEVGGMLYHGKLVKS